MRDLTSRTIQEINELVQKYKHVLEISGIKTIDNIKIFAVVIDIAIKHIEEKHSNINTDLKAWSVVAVKKSLNKLKTENDVKELIDDFIEYYNAEFEQYLATMCEYPLIDLECDFVHRFVQKRKRQ